MIVPEQMIEVKWSRNNKKWFMEKGYTYTDMKDIFFVKPEELMPTSTNKVEVICDYCLSEDIETRFIKPWSQITSSKHIDSNKHACVKCRGKKMKEVKLLNGTLYTEAFIKANEKSKLDFNKIINTFTTKGYKLLTNKYVNNRSNLEFICLKHESYGTQFTSASRLKTIKHNCKICQLEMKEMNRKKKLNGVNPLDVYLDVLDNNIKIYPHGFFKKFTLQDFKPLLEYYVSLVTKQEKLDVTKMFCREVMDRYKISNLLNYYNGFELLNTIYPDTYKPWLMNAVAPHFWDNVDNIRQASNWFYEQLYKDGIIQSDDQILNLTLGELFKEYKLDGMYYSKFNSSHVDFWNFMFPNRWYDWEFKMTKKHYWEDKYNRITAMKQLIEEKLNISIYDIPNIISYPFLVNNFRKFSAICDTYYHSNIYAWINECYPDKFKLEDFKNIIGRDGTVLDSLQEKEIHDILITNNVNFKYYENKVANSYLFINQYENESYIPDWIINDFIIVEYFGWYVTEKYKYNLIKKYIDKADRKIKYYNSLLDYQFIDLYPSDLQNNYEGLIKKFAEKGIEIKV
ncbi:hypothetical protein NSQ92_09170 [Niallia sp. FSL M8-0099]